MTLTLPSARRVLVVAPHPDDEVIGAWALIRRFVAVGVRVDVLIVSDGAASHPQSRSWPPHRLVPERRRETLRALRRLSIPPTRVRFLMLPDGGLEAEGVGVARQVARARLRRPPADLIVGPSLDDAHGDHRAVARALARSPRRGARRLGYRVWPMGRRRGPGITVPLRGHEIAAKRHAIRCYRTQSGRITDAVAGCTLTRRHLAAFARPSERFQVLP